MTTATKHKVAIGNGNRLLLVLRQNGEMCRCKHHERPHHKPSNIHSYKLFNNGINGFPFRTVAKLLPNGERSTKCRVKGCHCLGFKKAGSHDDAS